MPVFAKYRIDSVDVFVWHTTENVKELAYLAGEKNANYAFSAFKGEGRQKEWLATRALLAEVVGRDTVVLYDAFHKPYLSSGGYLSISHTGEYVAVALSCVEPVGVDIELLCRNVEAAAYRFVNEGELEKAPYYDRNTFLLCCWCAKEALFKLAGNLGGTFKDNISVDLSSLSLSGSFMANVSGLGHKDSAYRANYVIDKGLLVVLCRNKGLINELN